MVDVATLHTRMGISLLGGGGFGGSDGAGMSCGKQEGTCSLAAGAQGLLERAAYPFFEVLRSTILRRLVPHFKKD